MISKEDILKKLHKQKTNEGEVQTEQELNFDVTDTVTIGGQKSSGKSWFMSFLANSFPKSIVYDSRHERFTADDKKAISVKALKMPKKWVTVDNLESLREKVAEGKTHILYHPVPLELGKRTREDAIEEFNQVSQFIFEWGNYTFFVDEADSYCDTHHIPDGFFNIMEFSKHRNIGIVAATRRLQHLNPRVPRLSDKLVLFRLSGKDFKYISEYVVEPEGTNKTDYFNNWKHELTGLEDRNFYVFDTKELKRFSPITEELI